jgi:hypothetical protein
LLGVNEDGREDGKHENYMSVNTKSTPELIAPCIRYPEVPLFPARLIFLAPSEVEMTCQWRDNM